MSPDPLPERFAPENMIPLRVTDYDPVHAEPLVRMWRASFEHGLGIVDHHPLDAQLAYLRDTLVPTHRVRLAWRESALVGFLAHTHESIAQLYVRVEDIGQGIGTHLLNLAESESSGRLRLYTFPRNARACRFYERHGFVEVARGFEPMWQLPDVRYEWVRSDRDAQPKAAASSPVNEECSGA